MPGPLQAPAIDSNALPARRLLRENGRMYQQLAALLREPILNGVYPPGTALPKEAEIAGRFGVSLITVRHALRELQADGLISKRAAKPAVVAGPGTAARRSFAFRTFADIAAFTRNAELVVRSYRRERSELASGFFGTAPSERLYVLRGLLIARGTPEAAVTSFFPSQIGSRLSRDSFDNVLIFRTLQDRLAIRLAAAEITVRAETADAALAAELSYAEGGAILAVELRYSSMEGEPVEMTIARHRADSFSLTYQISNEGS
jgi:GntR family transcriptional regulator